MDNKTKQDEEVEALSSIYGDEWKVEFQEKNSYRISLSHDGRDVTLFLKIPDNYPSEAPPTCEMSAPSLTRNQKTMILDALNELYIENLGETVLYQWIEKVREILEYITATSDFKEVHQSVAVMEPELISSCPPIVHGHTIEDRKSVFQAHVARLEVPDEVNIVMWNLKVDRKIADATHNIVAWRCGKHEDCDDDGEKQAGPRLLRLLNLMSVNNVIVVVSRWYGGTQLGPDRFRHINNAARQALVQSGIIPA